MQKTEDMVVIARNPGEMQIAQEQLVDWAAKKIEEKKAQYLELKENHFIAAENGWKTSALKRNEANSKKEMEFYEKVHAALEAGYCIIPNMDLDVFAVRTTRFKPPGKAIPGRWNNHTVETNRPVLGDGKYVDSDPEVRLGTNQVKNSEGQMISKHFTFATEFQGVDFPFKMAKPQILDATAKAMARKIFDDIGVLPERTRRGDPMVVGRITHKKGYTNHTISFLITWFVDTKDFI
ncbi:MAG TPA: hypothetical protein VMY18_14855 [Acidobacteriota bacterium]|nr:hypothetical protein [Acidobacteriota bacterium]